jgi:hypothetical protein
VYSRDYSFLQKVTAVSNPRSSGQGPSSKGKLMGALQIALENIGSQLKLTDANKDIPVFRKSFARVEHEARFCQIMIITNGFSIDFWDHGVCLVNTGTSDVHELAKAIHVWIDLKCNLDTLNTFSFINVPLASYVHGRGEEVEQRWENFLNSIPTTLPELSEFVIEAYKHPKLRQLFPFTSLNTFCLSRCTGYPYTNDLPIVIPAKNNEYEVVTRDGKGFGPGNAKWAVKTVEANLPENCGPAIIGTAEEMDI